jgi:GNAT superfamily N-acetyltransferase
MECTLSVQKLVVELTDSNDHPLIPLHFELPEFHQQVITAQYETARHLSDAVSHWLVQAKSDSESCNALLTLLSDKTASLWMPLITEFTSDESTVALLNVIWDEMAETSSKHGCQILQFLLDKQQTDMSELIRQSQLPYLTDLLFYELNSADFKLTDYVKGEFKSTIYRLVDYKEIQEAGLLLDQTYLYSLDCPEVLKGKSGLVVLNHFWQQMQLSPVGTHYLVLQRCEGKPVGIMLLKQHLAVYEQEQAYWELSYMGVSHEHRGQGLGRELLAWSIEFVKSTGCYEYVVAVDRRNKPAVQLYEQLGFACFHEQNLFARMLTKNECRNDRTDNTFFAHG